MFIIDVDNPSCDWFLENNWILDENPMMVKTKRGWHLYFRTYEDHPQRALAKHVDVRCCGKGFVVAPGSVVDGWEYKEVKMIAKDDLPAVPDEVFMHKHVNGANLGRDDGDVMREKFRTGERNKGLTAVAGKVFSLLYNEIDYDFLLIFLHTANRYKCEPPLEDAEVNSIARSIYRREMSKVENTKSMFRGLSG